jgi:hypothetical protein
MLISVTEESDKASPGSVQQRRESEFDRAERQTNVKAAGGDGQ